MYKVIILLVFLCLTLIADQNNTLSEKQKMQDEILIHSLAMSQFLQTIDENDSIADAAMDTYTNCYIEKMKDMNNTDERKTDKFINNLNSVDYYCFGRVYNKYSLTPKVDNVYKKEISEVIRKHVVYPVRARRLGMTGTVYIGFILSKSGNLHALRIDKSSKFDVLDNAALDSVKKAAPFFPKPTRSLSLGIPIEYKLSNINDNNVTKKSVQLKKSVK